MRRVRAAVQGLPERHRVVLSRMEGLTRREAGERVRVSRPTAASREGEAQALLRRALGERARLTVERSRWHSGLGLVCACPVGGSVATMDGPRTMLPVRAGLGRHVGRDC
jgi:hypothetical protein